MAATWGNLRAEVRGLNTNLNTQVYIYVGDHGAGGIAAGGNAVRPNPAPSHDNTFVFPPFEVHEIAAINSRFNSSGPYLLLEVSTALNPGSTPHQEISPNYTVVINGKPANNGSNHLPAAGEKETVIRMSVNVDDLDLEGQNVVHVLNPYRSDPPIHVEMFLLVGDVATNVVEEEPPSSQGPTTGPSRPRPSRPLRPARPARPARPLRPTHLTRGN